MTNLSYENLPNAVKNNVSEDQWDEVQRMVVPEDSEVPQTTQYINLKDGYSRSYEQGEKAPAPLLATHDLAGARGKDDIQFRSSPPDAHMP